MAVTKPYKFIWFGDTHGPKPYEFIWLGDIHGPKPYKFKCLNDIHGPKPYIFIWPGDVRGSKTYKSICLPGRESGFRAAVAKPQDSPSGRPSAGRRVDVDSLPTPISGPETLHTQIYSVSLDGSLLWEQAGGWQVDRPKKRGP